MKKPWNHQNSWYLQKISSRHLTSSLRHSIFSTQKMTCAKLTMENIWGQSPVPTHGPWHQLNINRNPQSGEQWRRLFWTKGLSCDIAQLWGCPRGQAPSPRQLCSSVVCFALLHAALICPLCFGCSALWPCSGLCWSALVYSALFP